MSNKYHKDLVGTDIHVIFTWEYADATARISATGFSPTDVGKIATQSDDNSLWLLTATTPSWKDIGMGESSHTHPNLPELNLIIDGNHDIITSGNPHDVNKTDVGLSNVDNTQQVPMSQKGVANGVAELDANGKINSSQFDLMQKDTITVTTNAQASFTLSKQPMHPDTVFMVPEDGVEQLNGLDFTVAATVVSYTASSPTFSIGDKIVFTYLKIN